MQSAEEDGTAFSLVDFNTRFGKRKNKSKDADFECFISMEGKRVENYSLTGGGTGWGAKNIIPILEKQDANIKAVNILVDNDAPLEEQAKLVAEYINKLKENKHCKKIHVLGLSKCGTMSVAMLKYLSDSNLDKLNVMSCLAPYLGTIYASPKTFYSRLHEVIGEGESKLLKSVVQCLRKELKRSKELNDRDESIVAQGIAEILISIHKKIFSDSHMDLDIAEGIEGIFKEQIPRYDEKYLQDMFGEETLAKLKKVSFTNITTCSSKQTLENAVASHNVIAGLLYLSSITIFDEPSDGMVSLKSASYIEEVCRKHGIPISTMKVSDGHHELFSDPRMLAQILDKILEKDKSFEER